MHNAGFHNLRPVDWSNPDSKITMIILETWLHIVSFTDTSNHGNLFYFRHKSSFVIPSFYLHNHVCFGTFFKIQLASLLFWILSIDVIILKGICWYCTRQWFKIQNLAFDSVSETDTVKLQNEAVEMDGWMDG